MVTSASENIFSEIANIFSVIRVGILDLRIHNISNKANKNPGKTAGLKFKFSAYKGIKDSPVSFSIFVTLL